MPEYNAEELIEIYGELQDHLRMALDCATAASNDQARWNIECALDVCQRRDTS
jgi:hypothetical protein